MGKPNYSFKKRQKELARKKKKEEKRLNKLSKNKEIPKDSDESTDAERSDLIESE